MDNIKISLFDLFAYTIPGAIALLAGVIFIDTSLAQLSSIATIFQNTTVMTGLVALIASYTIGCAIDTPGSLLYYKVGCRIWGQPYNPKGKHISHSVERALVRHFSPENHSYAQTWKIIKTMSHNVSFAFILLGITAVMKVFEVSFQYQWEWIFLAVFSLITSVIFLNRASVYDKWYYRDLTDIVQSLHLEQKALKEVETGRSHKGDNDILKELLIDRK